MSALQATADGDMVSNGYPEPEKKTAASLDLEAVAHEVHPVDPEVARRVLRKIDLFLMPAMVIGMMNLRLLIFQYQSLWLMAI